MNRPTCYGHFMMGAAQAERDCNLCEHTVECVDRTVNGPSKGVVSDGSTASYYELPAGATELQDLISHLDLNAQMGEIMRATYRYGRVEHSPKLRDIKKIIFYAEAEKARLEKLGAP